MLGLIIRIFVKFTEMAEEEFKTVIHDATHKFQRENEFDL